MGLLNDFSTNEDSEKKGVVVNYGDYSLKIARAGGRNHSYTQALAKATKPHRRAIAAGHMKEAALRNILIPVYARYVLVGWEGVTDLSGENEIPYTPAKAEEFLKSLPDLFEEVQARASDISLFQDADGTEVAAGN